MKKVFLILFLSVFNQIIFSSNITPYNRTASWVCALIDLEFRCRADCDKYEPLLPDNMLIGLKAGMQRIASSPSNHLDRNYTYIFTREICELGAYGRPIYWNKLVGKNKLDCMIIGHVNKADLNMLASELEFLL